MSICLFAVINICFMESQQGQKEEVSDDILLIPAQEQLQASEQPKQSEYTDEYLNKMLRYNQKIVSQLPSLKSSLEKNQIYYDPDSEVQPQILFKVARSSINMQVVNLKAEWGQFSVMIAVLNITRHNHKHGQEFSTGGFGSLYWGRLNKQKFVLKCIQIKHNLSRMKALKEWFILKIASALQIGPYVGKYFGFDLLMYQDCVEFPMELCDAIIYDQINDELLYWNLVVMHQFHIVHMDIKPQNIMLSPTYRKPIFIDFGLSKLIKQKKGFKSLTGFAGSPHFCSPEMGQHLWSKSHSHIDLYYNDLYSLQMSLKSIHGKKQKQEWQSEEEEENEYMEPKSDFSYLIQYRLKHCLYKNQIQEFLLFWGQLDSCMIRQFTRELLDFFQELLSHRQLKCIFEQIFDDSYSQTPLYNQIKVAFENRQTNLSLISTLRDNQKFQKFKTYCDEYLNQKYQEGVDEAKSKKMAISETLLSIILVKKLPYLKYVQTLLGWMSFTNNKFEITSKHREEVSKVYHSLFMANTSLPTNGRDIVQNVILDILYFFLRNTGEINPDLFALNLFRIFDYLVILDAGTLQNFLLWLDRIYNHTQFHDKFKHFFLIRVIQSTELISFRITLKKGRPRIECVDQLLSWAFRKKSKLQDWPRKSNSLKDQEVNFSKEFKYLGGCPYFETFLEEYGFECLLSNNIVIQNKMRIEKLLYLYDSLCLNEENKKLMFFLLYPFRQFCFHRNSKTFILSFQKVFSNNLADESIEKEFSLPFLITFLSHITDEDINFYLIDQNIFNLFNQFFLAIHPKDLIFYKLFLFNIFNKIQIQQAFYQTIQADTLLSTPSNFIIAFARAFLEHILGIVTQSNDHKCFGSRDALNLLTMSKTIGPALQGEVREFLFSKQAILQVSCCFCRQNLKIIDGVNTLQHILAGLIEIRKNNKDSEECLSYLTSYFEKCGQLEASIRKREKGGQQEEFLLEKVLNMAQLVCCLEQFIENKFQGIYKYFLESEKQKKIIWYFKDSLDNSFPMMKTLEMLWHKHNSKFLPFLLQTTRIPQTTHLSNHYLIVFRFAGEVLMSLGDNIQYHIFMALKDWLRANPDGYPSTAVIYHIMLDSTQSFKFKKQVCSCLFRIIHKLYYVFRRKVMVTLYLIMFQELTVNPSSRRKYLFINNRLVKLLISQEYSINTSKKEKWVPNPLVRSLRSKFRVIPKCQEKNICYKFKAK